MGDGKSAWTVEPVEQRFKFRTDRRAPKLGIMLVGLGGNNGTTLMGGVVANREGITWKTKEGIRAPDYFGSLTQSATCRVGAAGGEEVFTPFKSLLPMAEPNEIAFDGWDISGMNMADAMERAQVLDWDLQRQLRP